jgi:predicted N-acetyltransferase YhbS
MGLNDFIHKQALAYQKENLGATYLFLYRKQIVGFVTLAMGEIQIKKSKRFIPFSVPFKDFPALLIGRLAVDNKFRKRGIGRNICLWVLGLAKELSIEIGCRFITLLTQGKTVEFYENCGFEAVDRAKKKVVMFKEIPLLKT